MSKIIFDRLVIVVTGNMNPAIHQPGWYAHQKLLEPADFNAATNVIVTPDIAQFEITSRFRIFCVKDRWEIQLFDPTIFDWGALLAANVFQILEHSPINAFGINFTRGYDGVLNTSERLASVIRNGGLELDPGTLAKLTLVTVRENVRYTFEVDQGLKSAVEIIFSMNSHHTIVILGEGLKFFELGPLILNNVPVDRAFFASQIELLLKGLPNGSNA